MDLPKDPMILLSYINTQLRDFYTSLDDLCRGLGISEEELTEKLGSVNYKYDADLNAFI